MAFPRRRQAGGLAMRLICAGRIGGSAPHRPARRDPVVDRRGQQPQHPLPGRHQRPVGGRERGAGTRSDPLGGRGGGGAGHRRPPPPAPRRPRAPTRSARATPSAASPPAPAWRGTGRCMNGLAADAHVISGTALKLPAGSAPAALRPSRSHPRARGRPAGDARPRDGGRGRPDRADHGVSPSARRGDRLAGERVQQQPRLIRERARGDADPARHVGVGGGQHRPRAGSTPRRPRRTCTSG